MVSDTFLNETISPKANTILQNMFFEILNSLNLKETDKVLLQDKFLKAPEPLLRKLEFTKDLLKDLDFDVEEFVDEFNSRMKENINNNVHSEFKYSTKHLKHFSCLREISKLQGKEYDPILKGLYYSIMGVLLRNKKISLGQLQTDTRLSCTIPLPSGQGKKNLKKLIIDVFKELEYDIDVPLSLHSQQLIGKVINRGSIKKPNWIQNEGYLSRDVLIFDEGYKLFTSKEEEIQESRRAVRIAKDPIGENLIEKKQVDNTFDDAEKISYFSKVTIYSFLQPKSFPSDIVEEGDLRRDLILYVKSIAERDKSQDYASRLKTTINLSESLGIFTNFLRNIAKATSNFKFTFTDNAIDEVNKCHKSLVKRGFFHSNKGANFSNMIDYTLQDLLVKLSCIISAIYGSMEVSASAVKLAFLDLMEFFSLQLDFVKDKIRGRLDYGEGWAGALETDQACLEWLYNVGATDEDSSTITIDDFKKKIAEIKKISYDSDTKQGQAVKHYTRFKDGEGWIDSKQVGKHSSKVWLTFKPKIVGNKFKGIQGIQGLPLYTFIISNIDAEITKLGGVNPTNPTNPTIKSEEVDLNEQT